jgi:hypothetical protein
VSVVFEVVNGDYVRRSRLTYVTRSVEEESPKVSVPEAFSQRVQVPTQRTDLRTELG